MKLAKGATVAVLDGRKLALFRNTNGSEPSLTALQTPELERIGAGSGGNRSTDGNPDDDTQEEAGFAAAVAQWLNKQAAVNRIDSLVVIAAPKTLGELRKHWSKPLEAVLAGEIAKDLTGHTVDQIGQAIDKA